MPYKRVQKKCIQCRLNKLMEPQHIYCGKKCYGDSMRKYQREFSNCETCGKNFEKFTSQIIGGWGTGKYCSRNCYYKAPKSQEFKDKLSKSLSGTNHPNWKGGVTKGRKERNHTIYKDWRTSVFERDKYTCVMCKAKNYKGRGKTLRLEADHIEPWATNPDKRFDINNGRTLCTRCHYSIKKETLCTIKKQRSL